MNSNRGVTPVVGVILIVAVTIILASVISVYALGITDDVSERPTYSVLELNFEEEPASQPAYDKFRWQIELTHTGGETVDADDIIVHLDHGDQRVSSGSHRPKSRPRL
jgi:flagellin-like protein